jgi:hypothetical protein
MPNESRGGQNKGSGGSGNQRQGRRDGSYSPEWLQRSRDDVPQTGQPLSHNPVVEAIMTGQSPTNEQDGQSQSSTVEQTPADSGE